MRYHQTAINANRDAHGSLNIHFLKSASSSSDAAQLKRIKRDDDVQIARGVMNGLQPETSLSAMPISVIVKDGIATLSGRADGQGEMWLIETAARRIAGVKGVMMKLEIRPPEPGIRSDDDIFRDCGNVLGVATLSPNDAIKVRVKNGWVSLSGNVARGCARWMAESAISQLPDVIGVNGQINVRKSEE